MIEKDAKSAKEWQDAMARGEVRPVTEADLLAAYKARKRKPRVKQVSPWMFVVTRPGKK